MNQKVLIGTCIACVIVSILSLSAAVRYSQKAMNSELAFRDLAVKSVELSKVAEALKDDATYFMNISKTRHEIIGLMLQMQKLSVGTVEDLTAIVNLQRAFMQSSGVSLSGKDADIFHQLMDSSNDKFSSMSNLNDECTKKMAAASAK